MLEFEYLNKIMTKFKGSTWSNDKSFFLKKDNTGNVLLLATILCSLLAAAIWNPKISLQKSHSFTASLPIFLHSGIAITSLSPFSESPELRSILKSAFAPNGKPSRVTNFHYFISRNIIHQTPNSDFPQWDSFNSQ